MSKCNQLVATGRKRMDTERHKMRVSVLQCGKGFLRLITGGVPRPIARCDGLTIGLTRLLVRSKPSYELLYHPDSKNHNRILDLFGGVTMKRANFMREIRLSEFVQDRTDTYPAPPIQNTDSGFVYLIGIEGYKVYKVGFSQTPELRLKSLKSEYNRPLYIAATIHYDSHIRSHELEWHGYFDAYRLAGEWFAIPDTEVEYFIRLAGQSL